MERKKEGFILPTVAVIVTLLATLGLVMGELSESKIKGLAAQKDSYYREKSIEIDLVPVETTNGGELFSDAVLLNSNDGQIVFKNQGHIKKSKEAVLWAKESQISKVHNWSSDTCQIIGGEENESEDCIGTEEYIRCKYKLNLPNERFTETSDISLNAGVSIGDPLNIRPGDWELPSLTRKNPIDLKFTGENGEYHITNFKAQRQVQATFGKAKYIFDSIIYTTSYNPREGYNLDFEKGSEVWIKDVLELEVDTKARFQGGKTFINKLNLNNSGVEITLGEGVYWIKEIILGNTTAKFIIPEGEKVKIYTEKITVQNTGSSFNLEGLPSQLLIVNYTGGLKTNNRDFVMNGFLYTDSSVDLIRSHINGAVITGSLSLDEGAYIERYDGNEPLPTRDSIESEEEMW